MPRTRKEREATKDRRAQMEAVAKKFDGWKPARDVLTKVKAHSTIFPQFDIATRVGGWPLQRFGLIHGPSNHGKTAFCHGLGLSFLQQDNFYAFVDAEYTTPEDWLRKLMQSHADHPGFVAQRPRNFEETVTAVRTFADTVHDARAKGALDPATTALIVVDSIRKLVPDKLLQNILKGKGGTDGASGRAAMMKAALNAQWLDELVPMLFHTNTALIFIARETENPDTDPWAPEFKVGGGTALNFDSSMTCRITRASWVKDKSGDEGNIIGEKHRITIRKTKVGEKEGKASTAYFHTSNGALTPVGFERSRDVFELAKRAQLKGLDRSGSWYSWEGERIGNGELAVVQAMSKDESLLTDMEARLREANVDMTTDDEPPVVTSGKDGS